MRSYAVLIAALAARVAAQGLDFDTIESAPPAGSTGPDVTSVVEPPAEVYDSKAAVVAAVKDATDIGVDPSKVVTRRSKVVLKRQNVNDDCAPQPDGYGFVPDPDTDQGFLAFEPYDDAATSVTAPDGYLTSFENYNGSVSMNTYMGMYQIQDYDPSICASYCDAVQGCLGINLYFERDPALNPAAACPNPPSITNIKCTLWGSAVTADSANNQGQWRGPMDANGQAFHVVIASSNGYSKPTPPPSQAGYTGPSPLPGAIDYPTTLLATKFYNQPYDPSVCAALCTGKARCNYFNAFVLAMNGVPKGLYCGLYGSVVGNEYATTMYSVKNNDVWTVLSSYGYSAVTQRGKGAATAASTTGAPVGAAVAVSSGFVTSTRAV